VKERVGEVARHEARELVILALRLLKDGLSFALLWVLLALVHGLQELLPLPGFAARLLDWLHQLSAVLLYLMLAVGALENVLRARKRRRG
jgi:hypothetical protein